MLKSRRGLLAAGLAVAVAGSIGVISTLDAGAEQIAGTPAAPAAAASSEVAEVAEVDDAVTPPPVLPWGSRPKPIKKGRPGASSKSLRGTDFDVAPADASGAVKPRPRYGPKGRMGRTTYLKSEKATIAPPQPADGTTAVSSTQTQYHYARGYQHVENDGASATLTIAKPRLDERDYHTLAEVAVQSGEDDKYGQIVEIGWTVDRSVNGDDDPHLFVYHWVNNGTSCYNSCGFVQYSRNVKPGDTLKYDVTKRFGIQYFDGNWWVAFDSEWIGFFPGSLWNKKGVQFDRAKLVQVFGEVASPSTKPCGTQMGNGQLPFNVGWDEEGKLKLEDNLAAARLASVTLVNPPSATKVNLTYQSSGSKLYFARGPSERSFLYGGPDLTTDGSPCKPA